MFRGLPNKLPAQEIKGSLLTKGQDMILEIRWFSSSFKSACT